MKYYYGINRYGFIETVGFCNDEDYDTVTKLRQIGEFGLFIKEMTLQQYQYIEKNRKWSQDDLKKILGIE